MGGLITTQGGPTTSTWQNVFGVVAKTRDYRGPGRPMPGDTRKSVQEMAYIVKRPPDTIIRTIEIWRVAAKRGLLPHPGEIPPEAKTLQDVPGWEKADWPTQEQFEDCLATTVFNNTTMPTRYETVQMNRTTATAPPKTRQVLDPDDYDVLDPEPANARIGFLAAFGKDVLAITRFNEADIALLRKEVVPTLMALMDHLPREAWDYGEEGT